MRHKKTCVFRELIPLVFPYFEAMNIHFIAIGGAAMHNLALALHHQGHRITGSDDQIFEPSRARLQAAGLLPLQEGWNPQHIHNQIDAVILGMHAKANNPELLKAKELQIPIYSYPAFVRQQTEHKTRVVIGGSHGKTTTTSLLMHGLKSLNQPFDYLVGAQIQGFERMVDLNPEHPLAILEGDEYLASALEPVPKFHLYQAHVAMLTGLAWDHVNVFPTQEIYHQQFHNFIDTLAPQASLIYAQEDLALNALVEAHPRSDIKKIPYHTLPWNPTEKGLMLQFEEKAYHLPLRGAHNVQNLCGALKVIQALNLNPHAFLSQLHNFSGAAKRMECLLDLPEKNFTVFRDFAHSPSKVKATVEAIKSSYPNRRFVAALELHTYSSLNPDFIPGYKDSLAPADQSMVFYDPKALAIKGLPPLSPEAIARAFALQNGQVASETTELETWKNNLSTQDCVWLLMSSGNWGGMSWLDL